jgi:chemotaxis protein methyltransferase CheR
VNKTADAEQEYEAVLRLFSARTGLAFRPDQRHATRQAVRGAMDQLGVKGVHEFARRLAYDDRALDELTGRLTVPETYFFREPGQFDYLRREILPEIRQRGGPEHFVRIWSAGCASGEEAYSLAMICAQEGLADEPHILATDISPVALGKAREASYGQWSLRGERAAEACQYLRPLGDRYEVDPQIRRLVQFEFLNLALDVYPSFVTRTVGLDVILCRNVLIYFNRETIKEVARRLFDSLAPGGWLITASGDPPLEHYAAYETVVTTAGVFYRRPLEETSEAAGEPPRPIAGWHAPGRAESEAAAEAVPAAETVTLPAPRATVPPPQPARTAAQSVAEAQAALMRGDYRDAVQCTQGHSDDPAACALHIKALANIDTLQAVKASAEAVQRHPLFPELHYLHAVLLLELNRDAEAVQAARRTVFLDRSLAIAHFTLGSILQRRGALRDAQRHFRNARDLCVARPPDEMVPLTDGEAAGQLAAAAAVQLKTINAAVGRGS